MKGDGTAVNFHFLVLLLLSASKYFPFVSTLYIVASVYYLESLLYQQLNNLDNELVELIYEFRLSSSLCFLSVSLIQLVHLDTDLATWLRVRSKFKPL